MPAVKKWFKAKKYGYGWTPQTFEGYLATLIYLILLAVVTIIFALRITDPMFAPIVSVGVYLVLIFILTASLLFICYVNGEKLHWSWGNKKKN